MEFRRKNGQYICKTQETINGNSYSIIGTSTKSKRDAREHWESNRQKKVDELNGVKSKAVPFNTAITNWYNTFKIIDGRVKRTILVDKDTIKHLNEYFGNTDVDSLTSLDYQMYLNKNKSMSVSSIKKRYRMLNMFLTYRYKKSNNPLNDCVIPQSTKFVDEPLDALTDYEIKTLVYQLMKPYNPREKGLERGSLYGRVLIVTLYCFLRDSEVIELRCKDIDMKKKIIHVRRQYQWSTHEIAVPKYKSIRDIPLQKEIQPIIKKAIKGKQPNELVFPPARLNDKCKEHIGTNALRGCLSSTLELLGMRHRTVHDLRHDGISRLVRKGIKATSVQKWAGHKSLTVTLDKYYRQSSDTDSEDLLKLI